MKINRHKKVGDTKVYIENEQTSIDLEEKYTELLKKTVMQCLKDESLDIGCEVNILLTDDESIRQLNNQHRRTDTATDVLSFPMVSIKNGQIEAQAGDFDIDEGLLLLGDIVISVQTAYRQALDYGHSLERELAFLTTHGVFHLLGYDHIVEEEEAIMISKQETVLEKQGLKRG